MTYESTREEIADLAARAEAAQCRGDGVHSTDTRDWHDWRLWQREPQHELESYQPYVTRIVGYHETWYCTRCRKIEERRT